MARLRAVAAAALILWGARGAAAELIDRVVAVVNDQVITLTDLERLAAVGILKVPGNPDSEEWVATAAHELVDRRVVLEEIDRFGGPAPAIASVERDLRALERSFGSRQAFEAERNRVRMSEAEVIDAIRDTIRIQLYVDQRFSLRVDPTDRDVAEYYRDHPDEFRVNGRVPPLSAIDPQVRQRAAEAKRLGLIDAWREELHHRARVKFLTLATATRG